MKFRENKKSILLHKLSLSFWVISPVTFFIGYTKMLPIPLITSFGLFLLGAAFQIFSKGVSGRMEFYDIFFKQIENKIGHAFSIQQYEMIEDDIKKFGEFNKFNENESKRLRRILIDIINLKNQIKRVEDARRNNND